MLSLDYYQNVLCRRLSIAYHRLQQKYGNHAGDRIITQFCRVMEPRLWAAGLLRGATGSLFEEKRHART